MSYASSPKSFPNFFKNLPHKLSQPTAIAVIASVGIHAALGFSLPYLPMSSQEKPKPIRNVQLLELKPEELSRVPPPALPLDPLSPSLNQQLKPLPPSGSSTLPSLPSLSSNTPSLGDLPSFDPLPSVGGSWKIPRRSTNLGKVARNSPVQTGIKRNPGEPPLPSEVFTSQSGKSSANPQFKIATGSKITNSSKLRPDVGGLTTGLLPANDNLPLLERFNSNQTSRPLPPPPPAGAIAVNPGFTGTQLQNQFGQSTSIQAPGQTIQTTAPISGQSNSASNSSDPNQQALRENVNNWSARNQVTNPPQTLKLSRNYPQTSQSAGHPNGGAVMVGVKVDENGKIISDSLQVMGSSFPNDTFDQEAISSVQGYPFPRTGKPEAYYVQVQFKHDSPVPGSVTGSPSSTDGKNSTERQNLPQRFTPTEQLTPPEQKNSPEWSTPIERRIPSLRPNSSEQPNPTEGKNPTERPNSSERSTPAEQLTPPKRDNSSERSTPTEQLTPPKRDNSSERSIPLEQLTPPKRENSSERSTPAEQLTPPKRENSSERSTPAEQLTPPKRDNSSERSTPAEQLTPPKRENASERSTPAERIAPPKRENASERSTPTEQLTPPKRENASERSTPTERIAPPKRENASERSTPTERITPPKRENASERSTPTERKTPVERQNSPEPRSSSESQNSAKPQKLPQPESSEKPQRLPQPPNSVKP
jgi:hypothetical protein